MYCFCFVQVYFAYKVSSVLDCIWQRNLFLQAEFMGKFFFQARNMSLALLNIFYLQDRIC